MNKLSKLRRLAATGVLVPVMAFATIGLNVGTAAAAPASSPAVTQSVGGGIQPMNGGGGGVNVNGWCNANYGGYAVVLDGGNPYSWRCQVGGSQYGVDMNNACVFTYGWPSSAYLLYWSAYGWRCY